MKSLEDGKPKRKRGVALTPEALELFQKTLAAWWIAEGQEGLPSHADIAAKLDLSVPTVYRILHAIKVDRRSLQFAFARLNIPWKNAYCTAAVEEENSAKPSAGRLLTESISLLEAVQNPTSQADALAAAANVALHEGNYALVESYNQQRLALYQQMGDTASALRARLHLKRAQMWRTRTDLQNDFADLRVQAEKLGDKALLAQTLYEEGDACCEQEGCLAARPYFEKGIVLYQEIDHKIGIAGGYANLTGLDHAMGRYQEAEALMRYCLALYTEIGSVLSMGWSLCGLGNISRSLEDYRQAQDYYQQGEALMQQIDAIGGVTHLRNCQGDIARRMGNLGLARELCSDCLEFYSQQKAKLGIGSSLLKLGFIALEENDANQAVRYFHDSVAIHLELGLKRSVISGMEALACGLAWTGCCERAALLFGACENVRQRMYTIMFPSERESYQAARGNAERQLGQEWFENVWAKGHTLDWDEIVTLVQMSA